MVVTSKLARPARLHRDHVGLPVDELVGDLFAEEKATALIEHGVRLYVGDHVADMGAARAARVPGIGVATGPCSMGELRAAGAAAVLADLTGFPAALDRSIRLALKGSARVADYGSVSVSSEAEVNRCRRVE